MRDRLVMSGWRPLVSLAAVTGVWASWLLGSYLGRMSDPPHGLGALAPRQVTGLIPAVLVAAVGAALATSRVRRRGAEEVLHLASRPQWHLSGRLCAEVSAAVLLGWFIYWSVTAWRFAEDSSGAWVSALAFMTSLTAIVLGSALGHFLALLVPRVATVPVAAVVSYAWMLFGGGLGDDQWWQGLNPSLGPYFSAHTPIAWFAAEAAWFGGLTLLLLSASARVGSRPRQNAGSLLITGGTAAVVGAAALATLNVT